jgi:transcriptional regulator with XRE-family HTH domain
VAASTSPAAKTSTVKAKTKPSLGERLESFRLEHGYTFEKLGILCGVSRMSAQRACHGKKLTSRLAFKVERFLGTVHAQ